MNYTLEIYNGICKRIMEIVMAVGLCPKCDHKVDVGDDPEIGQRCQCNICRADLVVVWLNPIELSIIDYEDFDKFDGDFYGENFQKIRKR